MSVLFSLEINPSDASDVELPQARAEHTQIQTGEAPVVRAVERV